MRGFSKVVLAGNLTRDPEMRALPSGTSVASFTIAINRSFRDASGENRDQVSFIDCSCWGKPGETIAKYCKKGSGLIVSGRLDQRSWEDKTSGQKRSRVEVVVEDFTFVNGNDGAEGGFSRGSKPSAEVTPLPEDIVPDDIPEGEEIDLDGVPF